MRTILDLLNRPVGAVQLVPKPGSSSVMSDPTASSTTP
jgi:hypothetical protein